MPKLRVPIAHRVAQELFDQYEADFGQSLAGYQGHVFRVIELVGGHIDLDEVQASLLGVAAFFHDASIWLDNTFDYLGPSPNRALNHLATLGNTDPGDADLVSAMIAEHHRQRRTKHAKPLVEAFRRADLTDVSFGLAPMPGTSRSQYRDMLKQFPSDGFRRGLIAISAKWAVRHPFNPLPMIRL